MTQMRSEEYFWSALTSEPISFLVIKFAFVFIRLVQKQLAFMLGRQQVYLYLEEEDDCPDADDLHEIMANAHLNTNFLNLAREVCL